MPVKRVSVVTNANALKVTTGHYSLEPVLSRIENFYPRIINSPDKASRSAEEEAYLLTLVTTQMARDPYGRAWIGDEAAIIF